jgi:hypothetical protein
MNAFKDMSKSILDDNFSDSKPAYKNKKEHDMYSNQGNQKNVAFKMSSSQRSYSISNNDEFKHQQMVDDQVFEDMGHHHAHGKGDTHNLMKNKFNDGGGSLNK